MVAAPFSILHYSALKEIKRLTLGRKEDQVTTLALGRILSTSQQTASRVVIDLTRQGYVERGLMNRKQTLKLTQKGNDALMREYNDLASLLEQKRTLKITGTVEGGLGEGKYYVSRKNYIIQFNEKLGYVPYLGTLNLRIQPTEVPLLERMKSVPGIRIDGFTTEDRTFGAAKAFRAKAGDIDCAVLMPERTVHSDIIELISREYLRERLNLANGNTLSVDVFLDS